MRFLSWWRAHFAGYDPLTAAAIFFAISLVAAFLAPWWRSYLGLNLDGYFPLYGHQMFAGEVPYRDFFLHLPPLHALLDGGMEAIFGKSILALKILGAGERILMAALLVFWLGRYFRRGPVLFGSLAAVILASGDDTEILDLYNYHALLFAIVAGLAMSYGLEEGKKRQGAWMAAGFFAALTLGMKQTIGLHTTLAVGLVPLLLAWRAPEARRLLPRRLAYLALGFLPPLLLIAGWLLYHQAFGLFLQQVFVDAGSSKGPPLLLLSRPWLDPLRIEALRTPALIAIGCIGLLAAGLVLPRQKDSSPRALRSEWPALLGVGLFVAALLGLSYYILHPAAERGFDLRFYQRIGVLLVSYGILWPAVVLVWRLLRRPLEPLEAQLLSLTLISGGTASALGFSWPAGEAIAFPGLALIAVLACESQSRWRFQRAFRTPALAAAALAILAAATLRMITPFDFAGWREHSPEDATKISAEPALAGMRLSAETRDALDGTLSMIRQASRPGEKIFVFPDLPIFYWLSDRPSSGFAALSWFDVTPDRIVDADRERIVAEKPVVIVFHEISSGSLEVNEQYFRGGKESALRRMQASILDMAPSYMVAAYYQPWKDLPMLQVWVRRDRAAELGLKE